MVLSTKDIGTKEVILNDKEARRASVLKPLEVTQAWPHLDQRSSHPAVFF